MEVRSVRRIKYKYLVILAVYYIQMLLGVQEENEAYKRKPIEIKYVIEGESSTTEYIPFSTERNKNYNEEPSRKIQRTEKENKQSKLQPERINIPVGSTLTHIYTEYPVTDEELMNKYKLIQRKNNKEKEGVLGDQNYSQECHPKEIQKEYLPVPDRPGPSNAYKIQQKREVALDKDTKYERKRKSNVEQIRAKYENIEDPFSSPQMILRIKDKQQKDRQDRITIMYERIGTFDIDRLLNEYYNYEGIARYRDRLDPSYKPFFNEYLEDIFSKKKSNLNSYKSITELLSDNTMVRNFTGEHPYIDSTTAGEYKVVNGLRDIYLDTKNKIVYTLGYSLDDVIFINNDQNYTLYLILRSNGKSLMRLQEKHKIMIRMLDQKYKKVVLWFPQISLKDIKQQEKCKNHLIYNRHPFVGENDSYIAIYNMKAYMTSKGFLVGRDVIEILYLADSIFLVDTDTFYGLKKVKYFGLRSGRIYPQTFRTFLFLFCKNTNNIQIENLALVSPYVTSVHTNIYSTEIIREVPGVLEISCDIWKYLSLGDSTDDLYTEILYMM
ncbi:hypothetical protein NEOKW01_0982 [Nematocida sp. AWRm80]|nr:hypothetical protein NEOKW01_0982 [Nematocida sp. AWRm80]